MNLLLIPLTAILLVTAQSFWNKAMKSQEIFTGGLLNTLQNLLLSPGIWIGGIIYIVATVFYLLSLSKNNFFVVQSTMTGLALVFSTIIAGLLFQEKITSLNLVGIAVVFIGAMLIVQK
jgi:drug/metabolite transporter (DMT)-like permease